MKCPNCGCECSEGSSICIRCGTNLTGIASGSPAVPAMPQGNTGVDNLGAMPNNTGTINQVPQNNAGVNGINQMIQNNTPVMQSSTPEMQNPNQGQGLNQIVQNNAGANGINQMLQNNTPPMPNTGGINQMVQNNTPPLQNTTPVMPGNMPVNNMNAGTQSLEVYSDDVPKRSGKKIIIILLILLLLGGAGFGVYYYLDHKNINDEEFDIHESNTFFIANSENKLALFNEMGVQITSFEFSAASDFSNGYAAVKKEGKVAIINTKGKVTVDYDTYTNIKAEGPLFKATDKDDYSYLIDGEGNIIADLINNSLVSLSKYDAETICIVKDSINNVYKIYNYEGKVIGTINIVSSAENDPEVEEFKNKLSVFYNKHTYIFDPIAGEELASFDSEDQYMVNNVSNDGTIIILYVFANSAKEGFRPKLLKDKIVYDLNGTCKEVKFLDEDYNIPTCKNNGKYYDFTDDFKIIEDDEEDNKVYIDSKNYAYVDRNTNSVQIYSNDKLVETVSCMEVSYDTNSKMYKLSGISYDKCDNDGVYKYYSSEGKLIFSINAESAYNFDENNLAIISDTYNIKYLINTQGEKVSDTYAFIDDCGDYYIVEKNDLYGILDSNGKELFPCEYYDVGTMSSDSNSNAKIEYNFIKLKETKDGIMTIYNPSTKTSIATINPDEKLVTDAHYFTISNEARTHIQYYSYKTGLMFYEYEQE